MDAITLSQSGMLQASGALQGVQGAGVPSIRSQEDQPQNGEQQQSMLGSSSVSLSISQEALNRASSLQGGMNGVEAAGAGELAAGQRVQGLPEQQQEGDQVALGEQNFQSDTYDNQFQVAAAAAQASMVNNMAGQEAGGAFGEMANDGVAAPDRPGGYGAENENGTNRMFSLSSDVENMNTGTATVRASGGAEVSTVQNNAGQAAEEIGLGSEDEMNPALPRFQDVVTYPAPQDNSPFGGPQESSGTEDLNAGTANVDNNNAERANSELNRSRVETEQPAQQNAAVSGVNGGNENRQQEETPEGPSSDVVKRAYEGMSGFSEPVMSEVVFA